MATSAEALALALQHHQAGNLSQAQQLYQRILQADPSHVDALHLLGVLASQVGRHDLAVDNIRQAIALRPQVSIFHNNLGFSYQALGRLQEAVASYHQAVTLQPSYAEAHNNLGNALRELGRASDAARCYQQALALRPDYAEAHNNLGVAFQEMGRLNEAVSCYQQALRLQPNFAMARENLSQAQRSPRFLCGQPDAPAPTQATAQAGVHNDRGVQLANQGKYEEAAAEFQRALQFRPDDASAHSNLGNILFFLGQYDAAVASYRQAVRYRPNYAEAHSNLGNTLLAQGRADEAIAHCREAVRLKPDLAGAYTNLGNALREKSQLDEATTVYQEALRLEPENADTHGNLAALYKDQGRVEEAIALLENAIRLRPTNKQRILLATTLPSLYRSSDDLLAWRHRLTDNVQRLIREGVTLNLTEEKAQPPFFLVYQGFNDRDVQRDITRLYTVPPSPLPLSSAGRRDVGKIRIGFASKHFRAHTIGRLMHGLIAILNRDLFTVVVFSLGNHQDPLARRIQQDADNYVEILPNLPACRRLISEQQLDVLFYTDIGMDPVTYSLAFSRLAPVQCTTWGHGVTTGIPTLDYFISSEQLESDESDQHYTEQLVRLKIPAVCYERPVPPQALKGRAYFGLPESGTLYGCPQTLFKFHPEFDVILRDILRRDKRGHLVLIEGKYPRWTELLRERFAKTLPDVQSRIRFVGQQDHEHYLNLNAICDVLLDPIHFGGGNTSYEGLALGVPVVTLPTQILRGRITWMLYHQMGITDCVVHSPEEYAERAVRLGTDADYRAAVSTKILASNGVLFDNKTGIRELEQFLQHAVARARSGLPPVCWPMKG